MHVTLACTHAAHTTPVQVLYPRPKRASTVPKAQTCEYCAQALTCKYLSLHRPKAQTFLHVLHVLHVCAYIGLRP